MAFTSEVSICSGRSVTLWSSLTVSVITAVSSRPGSPTFTSRISAPFSSWEAAMFRIYAISRSFRACLSLGFPVGLIRSPMITGLSPRITACP